MELDESLKEKQEEAKEREKEYEALLQPVLDVWQSGNMEEVKRLIRQDNYNQMAYMLGEGERYYCGGYDENGERSGIGVGAYRVHEYYEGDISIYYLGEWKNGKRNGKGNWLYSINEYYGVNYECNWIDDFPEGDIKGEFDHNFSNIEKYNGVFVSITGNVTHDVYNSVDGFLLEPNNVTSIWRSFYDNGYVNILDFSPYPGDEGYHYIVGTVIYDNFENAYFRCNEEDTKLQYGLPGFADEEMHAEELN